MQSCIYRGRLVHQRHEPVEHRFGYPICMLYLDLDELPDLFDKFWLWSAKRPALAWFRRADHVGEPDESLSDTIRALVTSATGRRPTGPIRLLTHLRYFGHTFNPASFFYCFNEDGVTLENIVVEVHNTPWKERHCYVIPKTTGGNAPVDGTSNKAFHVSPFLPMDMHYEWKMGIPGEQLALRIRNKAENRKVHDARMSLSRLPITSRTLALTLARFPLQTVAIVWRIHWQAFRLWRKGVTFHTHPDKNTTIEEKYSA